MKLNQVVEKMYLNILTKTFCSGGVAHEIQDNVDNYYKATFNLEFNKYFLHKFDDVEEISPLPECFACMKKFIRKIRYFPSRELFILVPVNDTFDDIYIFQT